MFTDMISNIFGRKAESTKPQRRKRTKRVVEQVHGSQTIKRTITVSGERFDVGVSSRLNKLSRRSRLRRMVVAEEQVFFDKQAAMHKEVLAITASHTCRGRKFVINPATISGARIPEQQVVVVTRVK